MEIDAIAAAVEDLESTTQGNDVDSIDPNKLRNLLKDAGASKLELNEATTLKNLGLRIWNVCIQSAIKHSTAVLVTVKVMTKPYFMFSYFFS